jgi:hypothetical protein
MTSPVNLVAGMFEKTAPATGEGRLARSSRLRRLRPMSHN